MAVNYMSGEFYEPQRSEFLPDGLLRVPVIEIQEDGSETESHRTFDPQSHLVALWARLLREGDPNLDLFDGWENGTLNFVVGISSYTGYLGFDFSPRDWYALFIKTLGCPLHEPCREDEEGDECHERNRRQFQAAIPDYPLMGRIFNLYEDSKYTKEEVVDLRAECEQVKAKVTERYGLKAVRKLIFACDKALALGKELRLICD